jgi:hypothetical protein
MSSPSANRPADPHPHDRFHPPAEDHPLWSETSWYAFSVPERRLAGTIYPLFRRNLGVCSLAVYVWDADAHEPWRVRYGRCQWHLPFPEGDLSDCRLGGLHLSCKEPLARYRVRYEDEPLLSLDLLYTGLFPPHESGIGGGRGHLDQPCRVTGTLRLRGEEIAVDGFDMRDRSWHVRDDRRSMRAGYSYGIASADEAWLAMSFGGDADGAVVAGFLCRDGVKVEIAKGTRRVLERHPAHGFPTRLAIEAEDRAGRGLRAEGRCVSRLANQATPGMFAWMSLTGWETPQGPAVGEDQDIWSPDLLSGAFSGVARAAAAGAAGPRASTTASREAK